MINENGLVITEVNGINLHLGAANNASEIQYMKDIIKSFTTEQLQELHILIASEIIDRTVA